MSIQDRDWYRESFRPKKRTGFLHSPKKMIFISFIIVLFIFLFSVLVEYTIPDNPASNAPIPQSSKLNTPLPSPSLNKPSLPVPDRSKVLYSSSKSQTIQYIVRDGVKYIEAEINGIPVEVMIDTGASNVALSFDVIRKIGIQSFSKKVFSSTAGGVVDVFFFKCSSIKVGNMELKNIDCSYLPTNSHNLLGNSFLSHFSYSFNERDKTVSLTCLDCEPDTSIHGMVELNGKKFLYYKSGRLEELKQ